MSQGRAVLAVGSPCLLDGADRPFAGIGRGAEARAVVDSGLQVSAESSPLYALRTLEPETDEVIAAALQRDAVARRILSKGVEIREGDLLGVRLNLNVMKSTGVAVHTLHKGGSSGGHTRGKGFYRGEVIGYRPVVELRDAYFNVHQPSREGIVSGTMAKCPMASVDGSFVESVGQPSFDGVAVRFNPHVVHLFVDEAGVAVEYAQHVTILGSRAYARGLMRYFSAKSAPPRAGTGASAVRFVDA